MTGCIFCVIAMMQRVSQNLKIGTCVSSRMLSASSSCSCSAGGSSLTTSAYLIDCTDDHRYS